MTNDARSARFPPRRLLFLLNSLASSGAENFVLQHVQHGDRDRFLPVVCHFGGAEDLRPRMEALGVEVLSLHEKRRPDPRAWLRLAAILRSRRIDVLQAHIGYSVVVARLIGRAVRVPAVVTTAQAMAWQWGPGTRMLIDATTRLPHAHVFISRADRRAQQLRNPALHRMRSVIIPNGIDTRAIRDAGNSARSSIRAELGLADDDFAFVNIARLDKHKGQHVLLRAFARALEVQPNSRLFIVGVGPEEERLRALALDLGTSERVRFLGLRLDVPRLLSGFDAYVHASTSEALGIAVLEAMAAGLPTLGVAVDGVAEFLRDHETGFAVPPTEPEQQLAQRMTWLASRPAEAQAVAEQGRALVQKDYDIRASVSAYEDLYDAILTSRTVTP